MGEQDRAVFVISVAAELAGVHPQTLRIYEREGLVRPKRTTANARRYSERDIQRLLEIKRLTGDGINLAGVAAVLELTEEIERRDLVPYSSAIVRYEHPSRYSQA